MKEKFSGLLETSLETLATHAKQKSTISLHEISSLLKGRGPFVFLSFLSLPFCQPLQIPGLAIAFGLAISLVGFRVSLGSRHLLPYFWRNKTISGKKVLSMAVRLSRILSKMKRFSYPRLTLVCRFKGQRTLTGSFIVLMGLLLAMPFPIPLSNIGSAWAVFLLSVGNLKSDGLFVLLGYLIAFLTVFVSFYLLLQVGAIFALHGTG